MIPKYVDMDHHVTEPPDFWTGRFSKKFAEKEPKFMHHPTLGPGWSWDGGKSVRPMGVQSVGSEDPRKIGNFKTFEQIDPGCYDPKKRLEVMDIDGAQAALLYPNAGGFFHATPDDDFYLECAHAYNDAIFDWSSAGDIKRLIPGGMLPMNSTESAVAEVHRLAKKGFKHIIANRWPSNGPAPTLADDPYWAAIAETGMVLSVHGFGGGRIRANTVVTPQASMMTPQGATAQTMAKKGTAQSGGQSQELTAALRGAGLGCTQPLAAFILSGVLERHPKLKVSLIETSLGWIPSYIEQMDAVWLNQRHATGTALKQKPSEYMHRIYASFDREWLGLKYREHHLGSDQITFASDYPHIGNFYPHTRFYIELVFQGIPEDEVEKILWSNAAGLYGLSN